MSFPTYAWIRWPLLLAAALGAGFAQGYGSAEFELSDVMIPVRDGVRLHTEIWKPKGAAEPLPFLMVRSPYGFRNSKASIDGTYGDLKKGGYIFVFQDIRGRYKSEGQFVMLRPVRDGRDPKAIDEGSDTYDTIEWLLRNVKGNNGRVGITGISYGGWLTMMALVDPHPALKAASEQASPADMYIGDDFHHNGAFRLSYGFEYSSRMETGKEDAPFQFNKYDTFDWYLRLGPLSEVNRRYFDRQRPTWNNFVAHPNYDAFWQSQAVAPHVRGAAVPNLNVSGWFDQEDFYGPWKIYRTAEKLDPGGRNFMIAGPWNHGGWARGDGRTLGKIQFGSDTAAYFREQVQAKWFAFWLKDQGRLDLPEVLAFETGTNEWRRYGTWPPEGVQQRRLYFQADGRLAFEAPAGHGGAADSFVSDPAHPVPYRNRPIPPTYGGPGWSTWLVDDQRFVDGRPDVLVYQTDPLDRDVVVAGDVAAKLFASTTGSDADWIVKLIDVYPDTDTADAAMGGFELMIAGDVLRSRFRESLQQPKALRPGEVTAFTVDLLPHNHAFRKGHRIMVQVQSTWFPVIDRNPQTFVPNIFEARASDYRAATHKVYRSQQFPSHVVLPVR